MYTFKELKKALKLNISGPEKKLAILGNCSTQFLAVACEGCAKIRNINLKVFDADYNQIEAQLMNPQSETYEFRPDYILLYFSSEKLYEEFLRRDLGDRPLFATDIIDKILNFWILIQRNTNAKILQINFVELNDRVFGNYSAKMDNSFIYQIRKLNFLLSEKMKDDSKVYPIDLQSIQAQIGVKNLRDDSLYFSSKMTLSLSSISYVATNVIDVICAIEGKVKKCIVLDLDNTLWGGVVGDDGIDGIEIGEFGRGHAFSNFQLWLKQLKERGVLLTVCSKNEETVAKKPFEELDEMVISLDDISYFVANWNDKASNIKEIQQQLNIGMDSFVFIDDNPFERNLVKSIITDITVPDIPEDPADYLNYLWELNLFETASFSNEDTKRTGQYKAEFQRKALEHSFESYDDYLSDLEMFAETQVFIKKNYSRIAQLTQRSNQFNLRTIRYSENDIERIANDESYIALSFNLKDKFGDHGLISVAIMKELSVEDIFIDTWLMSCRVLKRGMEEFVVNELVKQAKARGYKKIIGEYIPSTKNMMVKDIYLEMGFEDIGDNHFELLLNKYKTKKNYIREI